MSQSSAVGVALRWLLAVLITIGAVGALATPASGAVPEGTGGSPPAADAPPANVEAPDVTPAASSDRDADAGSEALDSSMSWVGTGAAHALEWALRKLDPGSPSLLGTRSGEGGSWFTEVYAVMRAMAIWVMVPLVLISIIHAISKGSIEMVLKTVLVYLPVAVLGSVVAVTLIQQLLDITDDISNVFAGSIAANDDEYWNNIFAGFLNWESLVEDPDSGNAIVSGFIAAIIVGPLMMMVCVTMFIILTLREASIYIATAFLPIGFATLVWPSAASYFRKLCEFLFAMIFSKIIIVAGVSLAVAGMAGASEENSPAQNSITIGPGEEATLSASSEGDATSAWLFQSLQAIVMLGVVSVAPTMLVRLAGNVGFDGASAGLDKFLNRPGVTPQVIMLNRLGGIKDSVKTGTAAYGQYRVKKGQASNTSVEAQRLETMGAVAYNKGVDGLGDYELTDAMLLAKGFTDAAERDKLRKLSLSDNPDDIAMAHLAYNIGGSRYGGIVASKDGADYEVKVLSNGVHTESLLAFKMHDKNGRRVDYIEPQMVRRATDRIRAASANPDVGVRIISGLNLANSAEQANAKAIGVVAKTYRKQHNAKVRVVYDGDLRRSLHEEVTKDARERLYYS